MSLGDLEKFHLYSFKENSSLTNEENFDDAEEWLKSNKEFDKIEKLISDTSRKDDKRSDQLRLQGNKFYEKKDFAEALKFYNESICLAEPHSLNLVRGYLNRSAVMITLKYYEECWKHIELIKSTRIILPAILSERLKQREQQCLIAIQNRKEIARDPDFKSEFKLSYPTHPDIPYIVDGLMVRNSETSGRGVFTTGRILMPGDLIAIEEPFVTSLFKSHHQSKCNNCLNERHFNLFPCGTCNTTMYCSQVCQQEDEIFHKILCPVDILLRDYFNDIYSVAVRMAIKILNEFNNDIMKCLNALNVSLDGYGDLKNILLEKKGLHGIMNLQRADTKNWFYPTVVVLKHFLMTKTPLKLGKEEGKQLSELLLKCILICSKNQIRFENHINLVLNFGSLLNHSCINNCAFVWADKKQYLFVTRNIAKNSELYITYGPEAVLEPVEARIMQLRMTHFFTCKCFACMNNIYGYSPDSPRSAADFKSFYDEKMNVMVAKKNVWMLRRKLFKSCCLFLRKYSQYNKLTERTFFAENELYNCLLVLFRETKIAIPEKRYH